MEYIYRKLIINMATSPFVVVEPASLTFKIQWKDYGTGGKDWSFVSIASGIPSGYANLGDAVYESWTLRDGKLILSEFYSVRCLFVAKNRPGVAKPCTRYEVTRSLGGDYKSTIYKPIYDHTKEDGDNEDEYVAIGHVVRKTADGAPKPGDYYCVNRRYLIDLGFTGAGIMGGGDIGMCYRTIDKYHPFRFRDNQKYALRTDLQLRACCTGTGVNCETLWKDKLSPSIGCQKAMSEYCGLEDIKPGGKCEDWCDRDPVSCDKLKKQLCNLHPLDPACDCINALQRPAHAELIKGKEVIYNMSLPLCYYPGCKREDVYKTTNMVAIDLSGRCAQDLKYIDQQIKVLGDNNVVDATMNSSINSGTDTGVSGTPPPIADTASAADTDKIVGLQPSIFWIILAVLFGILMYWVLGGEQRQAYQPYPMPIQQ